MQVQVLIDEVVGVAVPDDPGGLASLTRDLITLRKATEAALAVCAARIDRLGLAKKAGTTTSTWLQDHGAAPASASRWIRVGGGLSRLDRTAGYFRDGFLSTEHVDAVVKGIRQITGRSDVGITDDERAVFDARSPSRRRADALHQLLDCGGGGDGVVSGPRTEVNVSVPADHLERASLEWMGPITEALAKLLACDSSMASVILDGQGVPIDISASKRLFTGKTRKATIIRDEGRARIKAHPQRTINTGSDGHPWLIPPADTDPQRRPLPAYNRRTMTLAA